MLEGEGEGVDGGANFEQLHVLEGLILGVDKGDLVFDLVDAILDGCLFWWMRELVEEEGELVGGREGGGGEAAEEGGDEWPCLH